MEQNTKGKLQEIMQKNGKQLPVYETMYNSLLKQFVSKVTLFDGTVFQGRLSKTVKEAEKSAAESAIKSQINFQTQLPKQKKTALILVDVENQNQEKDLELLKNFQSENTEIIGVCSQNFPADKKTKYFDKMMIAKSKEKEVADIFITWIVINALRDELYENYFIISADKYLHTLQELEKIDEKINANIVCFSSVPLLYEHLNKFNKCAGDNIK